MLVSKAKRVLAKVAQRAFKRSSSRLNSGVAELDLDASRGIYLCGFARGGTTWARRAIGAHQDVFEVPGQVEFGHSDGSDVDREHIDASLRSRIRTVNDGGASIVRARNFVTKSPPNSLIMDQIMAAVPNAKMLYIVRDPRDVLISHQRTGVSWTDALSDFDLAMNRTAGFYKGLLKAKQSGSVYVFRYEDLHQRFPHCFAGICNFLGLEAEPAEISRIMHATSFSTHTGREHEEQSGTHARRGVCGDWVRHLTYSDAEQFRADPFWVDMMREHGYGWDRPSLGSMLDAASRAGIIGSTFNGGRGLRIVLSLSGGAWDYPDAMIKRLNDVVEAAKRLGYPIILSVDGGVDKRAVPHIRSLSENFEVGSYSDFHGPGDQGVDATAASQISKTLHSDIKRAASDMKALGAREPMHIIECDNSSVAQIRSTFSGHAMKFAQPT